MTHGVPTYVPVFALNPQVGPPLTIPSNCPFDENSVFTFFGNSNGHETINKNGGWGGGTVNGTATLSEITSFDPPATGPATYAGRGTAWFGGGSNVGPSDTSGIGQAEEGETFHFIGVGTDGNNTPLDVSISYHGTINNLGQITNFRETYLLLTNRW